MSPTETLEQYRELRAQLEKTAKVARKAMQDRYEDLLTEAAQIQADFKRDFGVNPELPSKVKTFTVENGNGAPKPTTEALERGKKIGGLRRSYNAAVRNRDKAAAAGKPTAEWDKKIEEFRMALVEAGAPVESVGLQVEDPEPQEPEAETDPIEELANASVPDGEINF